MRSLVERRWSDLDLLGHVNNVAYLLYLEEARVRLLRDLAEAGAVAPGQVVVRHEIDYVQPLTLRPEPIAVDTWVERVGTSSYTVAHEILDDDGTVAARARSVLVCFDPLTAASVALSDTMRAALATMLDDGPQ